MSTRRWYAAGLGAVVLLALGACTGDGDDPGKSPSSSSSSTTSGTPTGTPTSGPTTTATGDPASLPPEARKHTPEGAAAFVKYWVEQSNEAWTRPDATLLPPLSDPDCIACKSLQETAEELVAKHHRYESDPVSSIRTEPVPGAPSGKQFVRLQVRQNKVNIVDESGRTVSTDSAANVTRTVMTVWGSSGWVLFDAQ